jgi:hypothetical protein
MEVKSKSQAIETMRINTDYRDDTDEASSHAMSAASGLARAAQ